MSELRQVAEAINEESRRCGVLLNWHWVKRNKPFWHGVPIRAVDALPNCADVV